jgi:hypothetical protein
MLPLIIPSVLNGIDIFAFLSIAIMPPLASIFNNSLIMSLEAFSRVSLRYSILVHTSFAT